MLDVGKEKIHGFINIDARPEVNPDIVCDVAKIHDVIEGADLIYASHVLEHFPSRVSELYAYSWSDALLSWFTALRPGGVLRVCVPDFEQVCKYYSDTGDIRPLRGFVSGGQRDEFDYHFHCWDYKSLVEELLKIGFRNCDRYDWRTTEHHYIDDYSQCYLPHMDKINGVLMSLNVEAVK